MRLPVPRWCPPSRARSGVTLLTTPSLEAARASARAAHPGDRLAVSPAGLEALVLGAVSSGLPHAPLALFERVLSCSGVTAGHLVVLCGQVASTFTAPPCFLLLDRMLEHPAASPSSFARLVLAALEANLPDWPDAARLTRVERLALRLARERSLLEAEVCWVLEHLPSAPPRVLEALETLVFDAPFPDPLDGPSPAPHVSSEDVLVSCLGMARLVS